MHRVDPKHRRAAILRAFAYALTLVLSVAATVVLLYVALGYRLDRTNGHVVRSGLLLVDNQPESAAIYVNNKLKDESTPGRFVLPAGSYDLKLARDGYRDWTKSVTIAASGVREVDYPMLIPNNLETHKLFDVTAPELVTQSQDKKLLLTHVANQATFELIELNVKESKRTTLTLPPAVVRENGQAGAFTLIEWALDNKHVLLDQTLPSGAHQYISLDVTKPESTVNISTLYGQNAPEAIHYVGSNTAKIYGLKAGTLSSYNLEKVETTTILNNIRSYQPYANDTVLFDRISEQNQIEDGIWKDGDSVVVHRANNTGAASLLKYAKYDDHFYFVVAEPANNVVTIYRDPLKEPVIAKQLPLVTLPFADAKKVDFSGSSEFVLIQNGKSLLVYDFNDFRQFNYALGFELAPAASTHWVNGTHLTVQAADGANYLFEYDGQNQQMLLSSKVGNGLFFASNDKAFYRFINAPSAVSFESTELVVKK